LVRVKVIGICPSDVRCVQRDKEVFPFGEGSRGLSGHEWSGEVVELVDEGGEIQVGDRVVVDVVNSCGRCRFCAQGSTNLCIHKSYNIGGFAEYVVVPASHMIKIPDNVDFDQAFMSEPVSCCVHAYLKSGIQMGDTLVVIGDGPLGLVHLQLGKVAGAKVILSGHHANRLKLAGELGADRVVNSREEDLVQVVKETTDGYGAEKVMVAVGGKSPVEEAIEVCASDGLICLFAGTYPQTMAEVDPNVIHYRQLNIIGTFDSTPDHYRLALNAFSKGLVKVKPLVSHRLPLDRLTEGFQILRTRAGNKVLIQV
jgi:L-iditol 2-dehydrogenase